MLIEIIKKVIEFTRTKGTWAIDRQGDDIDNKTSNIKNQAH